MQSAPRILYMRIFSGYFETKFTGMSPINIIKGNSYFALVRERIATVVKLDFMEARAYTQVGI